MTKLNTMIMIAKDKTANKSPSVRCWRLVHDTKKVIALFESEGDTMCIHEMFCATTEKECLDEIARLKLEYKPEAI